MIERKQRIKMQYLYSENDNFQDLASGRVLYGGKGIPNFPVRLLIEIFGRALSYSKKKDDLVLYDPCCGGGYALTVLGLFHNRHIRRIYGSDIDENMVAHAKKNTALLSAAALDKRRSEIEDLYDSFGKASHKEALESWDRIRAMIQKEVAADIFRADCTAPLPDISPDIIFTDVPYGGLVEWGAGEDPLDAMLEQLWKISHEDTVLAVCMDKKQKIACDLWERLEKQNIGKRRFEILKKRP